MTITAGPIATAASVLGANAETARPIAEEAKDSTTIVAANLRNRGEVRNEGKGRFFVTPSVPEFKPAIGNTTAPKHSGKNAPAGNSATIFPMRYGTISYAPDARSRSTMVFSDVKEEMVFMRAAIAALIALTCSKPHRS